MIGAEGRFSRRQFLTAAGVVAGAASPLLMSSSLRALEGKLPIHLAGYNYERVAALSSGAIGIDGCEVSYTASRIGDMNSEIFSGQQRFDVTEIGLHPYMLAYANHDFRDYTLLPIFPLRLFRHKSVFIRNDRGIKTPGDLRGRKIATPGYSSTSLTWVRGIFEDEYGISPQDVEWVTAVKDSSAAVSGGASQQESVIPDGVPMTMGPPGMDESDLLERGEVDALFHAAEPRGYIEGHPRISRLFTDTKMVEQAYYRKTGIFPIMHAVAVRKTLLEQYPWLAQAIFNAYSEAKQLAYMKMRKTGWYMDASPWYGQALEETQALMGKNFYSYGIKGNRKTLDTLFRYSHQQGFSKRQLTIGELFFPAGLAFTET